LNIKYGPKIPGQVNGPFTQKSGQSLVFTVVFIFFEQIARYGVEQWGMHEFCWMSLSFLGFVAVIWWRGQANSQPKPQGLTTR